MKRLPLPSPTPILEPVKQSLFSHIPYLNNIPDSIIWAFIGAIISIIVHWLYGLVMDRRTQTVEIAMKNALNQARSEWHTAHTENLVEMAKLTKSMERLSEQMEDVIIAVDSHGKDIHKIELRISHMEGRRN